MSQGPDYGPVGEGLRIGALPGVPTSALLGQLQKIRWANTREESHMIVGSIEKPSQHGMLCSSFLQDSQHLTACHERILLNHHSH